MFCSKEQNYCAHGRTDKKTCYNKFELLLIAEEIERIEARKLNFKRDEDIMELWRDISSYMKSVHGCTDELCWVETLKLQQIEKVAFKPKLPNEWLECNSSFAPNNNCMNTWLSNMEIDEVLGQLKMNVPKFDYLGAVPIDFANLSDKKVNKFTLRDSLANKKTKIGIVFNTDPSYKGGQHWICAFIDLENNEMNFFDSYGSNGYYPKEIEAFFNKLIDEGKSIGVDLKVKKNIVRHQYKNSECGVYCIKFITERLTNTFEQIVSKSMPDDVVTLDRWKKFFRTETCRPKKVD
jgi:uncharacterized protein (UPF0335 family)